MFRVGVISAIRASSSTPRSETGTVTPNTRLRPSPDFSTICIDILELSGRTSGRRANPRRTAVLGMKTNADRSAEGGGYVTPAPLRQGFEGHPASPQSQDLS